MTNCVICNTENLEDDELADLKCEDKVCWSCLKRHIVDNLAPKIKCPRCDDCLIGDVTLRKALDEDEIRKYEQSCYDSIVQPTFKLVKCLLEGCDYTIYVEDDLQFECGVCRLFNCTLCNGVHPFMTCQEFSRKRCSHNRSDKLEIKEMVDTEKERARESLMKFKENQQKQLNDELEQLDLMPNDQFFECSICTKKVAKGDGAMLRRCKHLFCKPCLQLSVSSSLAIPILCPQIDCKAKLQDREIRVILTEEQFCKYEKKSVAVSIAHFSNSYHCKTPDCSYLVIIEEAGIRFFDCPICKRRNCLKCKVIHKPNEDCDSFMNHGAPSRMTGQEEASIRYLKSEINKSNCMECPSCKMIISKDGGCNWLRCPSCKLEICWILKMRRWGPKGPGDISGGCKCGVNGVLCDPNCYLGCMPDDD